DHSFPRELHRVRALRVVADGQPGGGVIVHLRAPAALLDRHVERGGGELAAPHRPESGLHLRSFPQLLARRNRPEGRRVLRAVRRALGVADGAREGSGGGAGAAVMRRGGGVAALVLGTIGLLGCAAVVLAFTYRHNVRLDLSPERRYSLSPHAEKILRALDR